MLCAYIGGYTVTLWRRCQEEAGAADTEAEGKALLGGLCRCWGALCWMALHGGPAESGAQLLARLEGRRSLKDLELRLFAEEGGPAQGDVVEFFGTEGTGKTEMLYHLVARCILPAEHGGLEAEVVFVDTDFHFDMLRLVAVLEHRLPRSSEEALRSCLHRLFVAHCGGTAQLLLTLHYLEGLFCSRPTLSLLVLDSVSTFYWTDRGGGEGVASQELGLRKCAELLQRLLRDYRLVLVATTQAIMRNYPAADSCGAADGSSSSSSSSSWRGWHSTDTDYSKPYLCRAWQKMVTHRLVFSRADAGQDGRQVFSIVSSSLRSKSTQRSAFYVGEGGVQFL